MTDLIIIDDVTRNDENKTFNLPKNITIKFIKENADRLKFKKNYRARKNQVIVYLYHDDKNCPVFSDRRILSSKELSMIKNLVKKGLMKEEECEFVFNSIEATVIIPMQSSISKINIELRTKMHNGILEAISIFPLERVASVNTGISAKQINEFLNKDEENNNDQPK